MIVTLDIRSRIYTHRSDRCADDRKRSETIRQQAIDRIRYSIEKDQGVRDLVLLVGIPGAGKSTWCKLNDRRDRVIYDACNLTPDRRSEVITAIGSQVLITHGIHMIYIDTPLAVCLQRNAARETPVPEDLVLWMYETLVPPTPAERVFYNLREMPPSCDSNQERV